VGAYGSDINAKLQKLDSAMDKLQQAVDKLQKGPAPPADSRPDTPPAPGASPAQVTVVLPADAKLYVDNVLCTLTSSKRSFTTPKLAAGKKYFYTLRVETTQGGQSLVKSEKVTLQAGQHVQVNFNTISSVATVKK
jgi:uncharacterized protein (TIGR03000 family)